MFIILFMYPFILTFIFYVSFFREKSFRVDVGMVLPQNFQESEFARQLEKVSFGPYQFHLLEKPDPEAFHGDAILSAILVIPEDALERFRRRETVSIQLLTNPDQDIKPKLVEELLRFGELIVNSLASVFEEPVQAMLTVREQLDLEQTLQISTLWYRTISHNQKLFEQFQDIQIQWDVSEKREQRGKHVFGFIFWVMLLTNMITLMGSVQTLFLHDVLAGLSIRWRASPNGVRRSYRDILLFTFLFGYVLSLVGWILGVGLLHVPPPPLIHGLIVLACMIFFMLGFNQFGMLFVQSERAMKSFVGFGGMVAFFLLGGFALILPGVFGPVGDYLPFKIGIETLTQGGAFPLLLLVETIPIGLAGIFLYYRKLMRQES